MKTEKITIGKFTKESIMKANKIASREIELENSNGWKSVTKKHKSNRDYNRKTKHKLAI